MDLNAREMQRPANIAIFSLAHKPCIDFSMISVRFFDLYTITLVEFMWTVWIGCSLSSTISLT